MNVTFSPEAAVLPFASIFLWFLLSLSSLLGETMKQSFTVSANKKDFRYCQVYKGGDWVGNQFRTSGI
jgi:hypothetical protein